MNISQLKILQDNLTKLEKIIDEKESQYLNKSMEIEKIKKIVDENIKKIEEIINKLNASS